MSLWPTIIKTCVYAETIQWAKDMKVEYCCASFEADGQLCEMEKSGVVDFIVTEDLDLIALGCEVCVFQLKHRGDLSGQCCIVRR